MESSSIKIISEKKNLKFVDTWYKLADENHFWMQWRFRALLRLWKDLHIPTDKSLLAAEIGCGHGVLRRQMERATSWIIDGIDLDFDALKIHQPGRGRLYQYDILEQRPEFKDKYDILILFDVIEHVDNPKKFLEAALCHLKPKGYVFINVPAIPWLFCPYDFVHGHRCRYNIKGLTAEFRDLECEILDMRYWGFLLIGPLILRKFFLSRNDEPQKICQKGFGPPNPLIHWLLKKMMLMETRMARRPCCGTSLLSVIQKR